MNSLIILSGMTESIIEFFHNFIGNDIATIFLVAMVPVVELRGAIPMAVQMGMNPFMGFLYAFLGCAVVVPIILLLLKPFINWMKKTKFFKTFAIALEGAFTGKVEKMQNNAEQKYDKSIKNAAEKNVNNASVVSKSSETNILNAKNSINNQENCNCSANDGCEAVTKNNELLQREKKLELKKLIAVCIFVALPIPMTGVWTGSAIAALMGLKFWKSFGVIMLGNAIAGTIVTVLSIFFSKYLDTILFVFLILVLVVLALFVIKLIIKMIKVKKEQKDKQKLDMSDLSENGESLAQDCSSEKEAQIKKESATETEDVNVKNVGIIENKDVEENNVAEEIKDAVKIKAKVAEKKKVVEENKDVIKIKAKVGEEKKVVEEIKDAVKIKAKVVEEKKVVEENKDAVKIKAKVVEENKDVIKIKAKIVEENKDVIKIKAKIVEEKKVVEENKDAIKIKAKVAEEKKVVEENKDAVKIKAKVSKNKNIDNNK